LREVKPKKIKSHNDQSITRPYRHPLRGSHLGSQRCRTQTRCSQCLVGILPKGSATIGTPFPAGSREGDPVFRTLVPCSSPFFLVCFGLFCVTVDKNGIFSPITFIILSTVHNYTYPGSTLILWKLVPWQFLTLPGRLLESHVSAGT